MSGSTGESPSQFAALHARAQALDSSDLLDVRLSRWMQSSGMSVQSWAVVDAFARKEGLVTLNELLADGDAESRLLDWRQGRHAAAEVVRLVGRELDQRRSLAEQPAESVALPQPPVGRTETELERWAAEHGVARWLSLGAKVLEGDVGGDASRWLWWYGDDGWTVGSVLCCPRSRTARGSRTDPPMALQDAAQRHLHGAAVAHALGARHAARAATRRASPPARSQLVPLHRALLSTRSALISAGAPPLSPDQRGDVRTRLVEDPPTAEIALQAPSACPGNLDARTRVDLSTGQVTCRCTSPVPGCAARLAAADALLDVLTGGEAIPGVEPDTLSDLVGTPLWQRDLDALDRVLGDLGGTTLGWRLKSSRGGFALEPATVTPRPKGGPALASLTLDAMLRSSGLRADRRAADLLKAGRERPGAPIPQALVYQALEALSGHPRVFGPGRSSRPSSISVHRLVVAGTHDGQATTLAPIVDGVDEALPTEVLATSAGGRALWVHGTEVRVLRASPTALAVLRTLAEREIRFPDEALVGLYARLPKLADVIDVRLEGELAGTAEPPKPAVAASVARSEDSFRVRVTVAPAPGYPSRRFSQHPSTVYRRGDRPFHVRRDLGAEREVLQQALHGLGLVDADVAVSLDTVLEVTAAAERLAIPLAWVGDAVRVVGEAEATDLSVEVQRRRDWFGLDGSLAVGAHSVPLRDVLRAIHEGRRWVELDDGSWVRLGDDLVARLTDAASVATPRRGALAVDPIHGTVLEALHEAGAAVVMPPAWRDQAARIRRAAELVPDVPQALNATLRPYQHAGFVWLARLAEWAPGAVLADDMGLGKTLQALALLLKRAPDGPALVVAPTSVGFNWLREAARFAPTLDVVLYRGPGREALLTGLGPGQVLVTSYALLRRDAEVLGDRAFHTVVLDEAQAIKNPGTGAAKAAHALRRDFCLALTGTPIENRVGELWSLFRAVVPGLLSSVSAFRERWALPIERDGDAEASKRLARLISPFLLRRRKGTVARDLPKRLESVVEIELSTAERALYEQERLAAARRLVARSEVASEHRMAVLAALTRLRQLACHPRLVDPDSEVPSSKLARLRQLVGDLVDSGHRALLFSQFTRHLQLARAALEEDGVRCRYLDGSTPADRRGAEVDAFQAGEGDVFLISLKAGGTGLNLTAANYVIHLDPWWNPAAEDQATDRAHRIGQSSTVTVYRLVSTGTVEESILVMHEEKRALADALIGGAARIRLDTDQLLELLGAD
ncbi:MAG: superfamily II DNA or RNA helicase [Myxococcota bacterium]